MSSDPFFTIILPTYNRAVMLPTALETLRRQTFSDFEVLIVDDGSTDQTPEIIKDWTQDSRFKYKFVDHVGNMPCRNLALRMATGTWITNIDSDDLWLPQRLEVFAEHIRFHQNSGFIFSNGYLYRFGRIIGYAFDPGSALPEGKLAGHYAIGRAGLPYLTTNLAIPRALYEKYGHYRQDMVILDNELYARMLADGVKVSVIYEPLAIRRIHGGQVTHQWLGSYPESIEALKASHPSANDFEREKKNLVLEFADYLWRNLESKKARDFMTQELGDKAKETRLYFLTFIPKWILVLAKQMRKLYLMIRYHPILADLKTAETYKFLNPLLEEENRRGSSVR